MQEITVRIHLCQNRKTEEWTVTCEDFPTILEKGNDVAELATKVQFMAWDMAKEKGLIDETREHKFSVESSFGYE